MTTNRRSLLTRAIALIAVSVGLLSFGNGCDGGREGERCNPDLSHNDCNGGLTCQQPSTCAENYCCPADPTKSSNVYCNGLGCPPAADAGDQTDQTDTGPADTGAAAAGDASDGGSE